MGLDMYLYAVQYIGGYDYDDHAKAEKKKALAIRKLVGVPENKGYTASSVTVKSQVAYWRKANQIHHWFVENVQDGVDECRSFECTLDQLKELRALCQKVLDSTQLIAGVVRNGATASAATGMKLVENLEQGKVMADPSVAEELLPVQSGFFFGGTDYDEYYVEDLKETITQLDAIFEWAEASGCYFEYQASW